ncbi:MAG: hypothetical protein HY956_08180 [Deltaproteobacteria bacterium]|nr:hypothetical protein [Deltaproteobacteria bacterium]
MKRPIDLLPSELTGKGRMLLKPALVFASLASMVFIYSVWARPLELSGARIKAAPRGAGGAMKAVSRAESDVIAEKDLFSPARKRYEAPKTVKAEPPPPPPPPPKPPPPRLKLAGTVLLNDGEAALIEYLGAGQSPPGYYRVGDSIEGFVVREIGKGLVLLERDGETLKVNMSGSQTGNDGRGTGRNDQPRDIPAGLLPARR